MARRVEHAHDICVDDGADREVMEDCPVLQVIDAHSWLSRSRKKFSGNFALPQNMRTSGSKELQVGNAAAQVRVAPASAKRSITCLG